MKDTINKKKLLVDVLNRYGKVIIAFSGGVDSTFLLKVAHDTLGDNVVAVNLTSTVFPHDESQFALEFCRDEDISLALADVDLLADTEFVSNDKDRCYTCKKQLFSHMLGYCEPLGIEYLCDGSIADDDDDYRPGKRALKELGVKSPLKEVGLTKDEIRELSKEMGLPTWDKPSMACLASRFPYGKKITEEELRMVEEAEKYLMSLGFDQVRVRIHSDGGQDVNIARIEVSPKDIEKISAPGMREQIYDKLFDLGFSYVSLDLKGYRTGSLNEVI